MVPADSQQILTGPLLLGYTNRSATRLSGTGLSTLSGRPFQVVPPPAINQRPVRQNQGHHAPQHHTQPLPGITRMRFSSFLRSPAATDEPSVVFSSCGYRRCFTSRVPHTLCIQMRVARHHALGFPISDTLGSQLVWQLPEAVAAYYVLHRLLEIRHPPCALHTYIHKTIKDARVHCAVLKQHTPTPPTPAPQGHKHLGNQCHQKQPEPPQGLNGAVSDTQQCVSIRTTLPHTRQAPSRAMRSQRVLRDSVPPN